MVPFPPTDMNVESGKYQSANGRCLMTTSPQAKGFNSLEHTFASIMLKQGAKPKVMSETLGHIR